MSLKRPCNHFDVASSLSQKRQRTVEEPSVQDLVRRLQETETLITRLLARVQELEHVVREFSKSRDGVPSYIS
jgi:hypothetical protein